MRGGLVVALVLSGVLAGAAAAQSPDSSIQETSDGPRHAITRPNWRKIPSGDEMAHFYPEGAMRRGLGGKALMQCKVAREGTLYSCTIISESPPNEGFGAAALKLAPYFEMTPQMEDGRPVTGGVVRIPIVFNVEDDEQASAQDPAGAPDPAKARGGGGWWSAFGRWLGLVVAGFIAFISSML